jgi:hypothetical protein
MKKHLLKRTIPRFIPVRKSLYYLLLIFIFIVLIFPLLPLIDISASVTTALHCSGNQILDANGNQVTLKGVNYPLYMIEDGGWWSANGETYLESQGKGYRSAALEDNLDQMNLWGINCIRFHTSCNQWVNDPGNFITNFKDMISRCASHGIYVVIEIFAYTRLSASLPYYPYDENAPKEFDRAAFVAMWAGIANTLKNYNNVIFEFKNEPHGDNIVYSAGTANFTYGNATVTGSGTAWTSEMVGSQIKLNADNKFYVVKTVDSANQITLLNAYTYTGGSGAYTLNYRAELSEYFTMAQFAINAIRTTRATQPLIIQWNFGSYWDFSGNGSGLVMYQWMPPVYNLTDTSGNLIYSDHLYMADCLLSMNGLSRNTGGLYDKCLEYLTNTGLVSFSSSYPILAGEIGCATQPTETLNGASLDFVRNCLRIFKSLGVSYCAWDWAVLNQIGSISGNTLLAGNSYPAEPSDLGKIFRSKAVNYTGWYDNNYPYRKSITLAGSIDGVLQDKPIKIFLGESSGSVGSDVQFGGHCKSDFSDLRFTLSDGVSVIPYWIESITGTSPNQVATVWVKTDQIPSSPSTSVIYVYYGYASAKAATDGYSTFRFFDDFERGNNGDALGGYWTNLTPQAVISTDHAYSGTRSMKLVGDATNPCIPYIALPWQANLAVRMRYWKEDATGTNYIRWGNGYYYVNPYFNSTDDIYYNDGSAHDTGASITADAWNIIGLRNINFTTHTFDILLADEVTKDSAGMASGTAFTNRLGFQLNNNASDKDIYIDSLMVYDWTPNYPTLLAGDEIGLLPSGMTMDAISIAIDENGNTSGFFNGQLTDIGYAATVTVKFQYGLSASYGNETAPVTKINPGYITMPVPSNLLRGRAYHFRLVATNSFGTSYGSDQSFTITNRVDNKTGLSPKLSLILAILLIIILFSGIYFMVKTVKNKKSRLD